MSATEAWPPRRLITLRQLPGLRPCCSATCTALATTVGPAWLSCVCLSAWNAVCSPPSYCPPREDFALSVWGGGETTSLLPEGKPAFSRTCPDLPQGQQTEARQLPVSRLKRGCYSETDFHGLLPCGQPDRPHQLPATTQEHCAGCDRGTSTPNLISPKAYLCKKQLPTKRHPQGCNPPSHPLNPLPLLSFCGCLRAAASRSAHPHPLRCFPGCSRSALSARESCKRAAGQPHPGACHTAPIPVPPAPQSLTGRQLLDKQDRPSHSRLCRCPRML